HRVEAAGALDDAGEQSALIEIELADILAEEGLGGLAKAIDGEAAALAEGDLVGVHLEDLLLGEAVFQLEGDDDLQEFAAEGLLGGEEDLLGELHLEGRATFEVAVAGTEIVYDGA